MFSHLCQEVASSKLFNVSQLACVLDCRCEVRTLLLGQSEQFVLWTLWAQTAPNLPTDNLTMLWIPKHPEGTLRTLWLSRLNLWRHPKFHHFPETRWSPLSCHQGDSLTTTTGFSNVKDACVTITTLRYSLNKVWNTARHCSILAAYALKKHISRQINDGHTIIGLDILFTGHRWGSRCGVLDDPLTPCPMPFLSDMSLVFKVDHDDRGVGLHRLYSPSIHLHIILYRPNKPCMTRIYV